MKELTHRQDHISKEVWDKCPTVDKNSLPKTSSRKMDELGQLSSHLWIQQQKI